ncbi:MAG: ribonuclease HII [Paracoccaceae bacterium]
MTQPSYEFEAVAHTAGWFCVAGVDEAGRGPLAGPVVAAAVVLDPTQIPMGLADSKKLSAKRRQDLAVAVREMAWVGVGQATVAEIDDINILRASHLAMVRALADVPLRPDHALIDGNLIPRDMPCAAQAVVKGDARVLSIAAASIIAKTVRDAIMADLHRDYPDYGWDKNAGYPTRAHRAALLDFGVTPHHRRSFAPVYKILCGDNSTSS